MVVRVVGEAPEAMRQTTCSNCAARLEFTDADTTKEVHRDYTGDADTYRVLVCPRCSNKIHVGERRSRGFY